jgi:hypothetical protein
MMPLLHNRLAVAAMFHAHISKLIRALEPHLSTAQKKQLKKEGSYKGQQERFASQVDANAKPACASYVRQIVAGVSTPGRKHEYIVHRYVEEAFKNMDNLDIVEAHFLTKYDFIDSLPIQTYCSCDLLTTSADQWDRVLRHLKTCKLCNYI